MRRSNVIILPGRAVPMARPRVGRGRAFLPKDSQNYKLYVSSLARAQFSGEPLSGPIAVFIWLIGQGRGDVDNFAKAILDGLNGIVFADDSQVQFLLVSRLPHQEASVVVVVLALALGGEDEGDN